MNNVINFKCIASVVVFCCLILLGCEEFPDTSTNSNNVNDAPIIKSMSSSHIVIRQRGLVTVSCNSYDSDNDTLSYKWSSSHGSIAGDSTGSSADWRAPRAEGNCFVVVRVSDSALTASDSILIEVRGVGSAQVSGHIYDSQTGNIIANANICFTVCYTSNIDGYYETDIIGAESTIVNLSASGYFSLTDTLDLMVGSVERNFRLEPDI